MRVTEEQRLAEEQRALQRLRVNLRQNEEDNNLVREQYALA